MFSGHVVHLNLVHAFLPPGLTKALQHSQSRHQKLRPAPWQRASQALPLCRHHRHRKHRGSKPVYLVQAVPALEEKDTTAVDSSEVCFQPAGYDIQDTCMIDSKVELKGGGYCQHCLACGRPPSWGWIHLINDWEGLPKLPLKVFRFELLHRIRQSPIAIQNLSISSE